MSHTPGPWTYDRTTGRIGKTSSGTVTNLQDSTGWSGVGRGIGPDEKVANGCLIAAAPDLLAACETVEAELNRAIRSRVLGETWTGLQLCLADAIAKARGQ
jgi:hypothetical protein